MHTATLPRPAATLLAGLAAALTVLTVLTALTLSLPARAQVNAGPYVPSPDSAVAEMLKMAGITPKDFVIDLGSGNGKIVLTAAKIYGASGFGVEIQDKLVKESNEAAKKEGVSERVKFITQDLFKTDISRATVLTMYLLPDTVNMLSDKLQKELRPGTRVLSHDYGLKDWQYEEYKQYDLEEKVNISGVKTTIIYLYVVPARVAGNWNVRLPAALAKQAVTLNLKQKVQAVTGMARVGAREVAFMDMKLRGTEISFKLPVEPNGKPLAFTGTIKGGSIEGLVDTGTARTPWSAMLAAK